MIDSKNWVAWTGSKNYIVMILQKLQQHFTPIKKTFFLSRRSGNSVVWAIFNFYFSFITFSISGGATYMLDYVLGWCRRFWGNICLTRAALYIIVSEITVYSTLLLQQLYDFFNDEVHDFFAFQKKKEN